MGRRQFPHVRALDVAGAGLAATVVLVSVLGGLVTLPLQRADLLWPFYWLLVALGIGCAVTTPRRRWATWAPWTFVVPWAVLVAWMPSALGRAPDQALGRLEIERLLVCLIISGVLLFGVRGSRAGLRGMRIGWLLGLLVSVAIGGWEIVTKEHLLFLDSRGTWVFGDGRLASGTFINPNNFATVLVGMIVGTLALRAGVARGRRPRAAVALDVVAVAGAVVVVFTQSRSALIALAVVGALEVVRRRAARRAPLGVPRGTQPGSPVLGTPAAVSPAIGTPAIGTPAADPTRRRTWWAALTAVGALAVASVTVPALARHNPLVELVSMLGDEETLRSDNLRIELIRAALGQLRDSGYLGSGAGAFEPLLAADPPSSVIKVTNLHNSFVELLSQYGIVVGLVHAVSLVMVFAVAAWPGRAAGRLARLRALPLDSRVEIGGYLAAYLAFGITASSALTFSAWWLLHASACISWWVAVRAHSERPLIAASDAIKEPIPTFPNEEGSRAKSAFKHPSRTIVLNACPAPE